MLRLYALALAFVFAFLSSKAVSAAPIELRSGTADICGVNMRYDTRKKCPGENVWTFDDDGELRPMEAPERIPSDVHCDHVVELQWIRNKIQGNSITRDICKRAALASPSSDLASEALKGFRKELEKKINGASNLVFVDKRVNIGKSPHLRDNPDYDPLNRIPASAAARCNRRQTQKGCATYLAAVEAPGRLTVETVQSIFANAQKQVNPKAPPLTLDWTNDLAGAIAKAQANIARYLCDERTQRRRAIDYTVEFYLGPILDRRGGQPTTEEKCDPAATSVSSTKRPSSDETSSTASPPSSVRPSSPLAHPISTTPHASMATSSQRLSSALVAEETPRPDRPLVSAVTMRPTNVAPSTGTAILQASSKSVESLRPSSTAPAVAGSQSQPGVQRIPPASSFGPIPAQHPSLIPTALPQAGPHSAPAVVQQQQGSQQLRPSSVPHGLPAASTRPIASASAPGYASGPKHPAQSAPKANSGRASPRRGWLV